MAEAPRVVLFPGPVPGLADIAGSTHDDKILSTGFTTTALINDVADVVLWAVDKVALADLTDTTISFPDELAPRSGVMNPIIRTPLTQSIAVTAAIVPVALVRIGAGAKDLPADQA